jgi:serine protease Do
MRARQLPHLILSTLLAVGFAGRLGAQPAAPAPAKSPVAKSQVSLEPAPAVAEALAVRSPRGVNDLRLIQAHLQRVIQQVVPATVAVEIGRAAGSGVIVSKEGLVLTAAHVISRPGRRAWVELPDGRRLRGRTLGTNHDVDAGMVQLDNPPKDLPFTPISKSEGLTTGEWVVTVGQPGGIVEGRAPPVRFGRVLFLGDDMVCTDCKLVGGDSGGPLFNMRGEVVGIHSSIGPMLNHNFHVPITAFRSGWERLLASEMWGGEIEPEFDEGRPILGVAGRVEGGKCYLSQVYPDLPADQAGVKVGDLVTAVDGEPISSFDELAKKVFLKSPGDKIELTIQRGGATLCVTAELAGLE